MGLLTPGGRVFVHNDCPGGGFLLPSSHVQGGMVLDEIDTCITSPGISKITLSGN